MHVTKNVVDMNLLDVPRDLNDVWQRKGSLLRFKMMWTKTIAQRKKPNEACKKDGAPKRKRKSSLPTETPSVCPCLLPHLQVQ